MTCNYKENWEQTVQNFVDWWNRDGLILDVGMVLRSAGLREPLGNPGLTDSDEYRHEDVNWRVEKNHYKGAETDPKNHTPFRFDVDSHWWKIHERLLELSMVRGREKYCVGCPDFVENIDILSALRGPQDLLLDMIESPDWVNEKILEINSVWFEVYNRVYEIVKDEEGNAYYKSFNLWGAGKTAKVQCDASSLFSPDMFERFVLPALTEQCNWLDYSMFHLDGHQCIPHHLDLLLSIEHLDAIEWTADPQVPGGGSSRWYSMYRKILEAGKSVQAIEVQPGEVVPLLDAVGGKGMHIRTSVQLEREAELLNKSVEQFR
ncbi:hypothetical protein ES705_29912 [subsurface metagenome]